MDSIAGIKFENSTKVYFFSSKDLKLKKNDIVVVESDLGVSLGRVVKGNFPPEDSGREYKPVLRLATEEDLRQEDDNSSMKEEAADYFNERVMARGLPMKLVGTEATLDRKRLLFYFVADNRIDFRELVKDLASKFRTRIELRQIGVRDAAKIVGGFGICGREVCCKTFLQSFAPISIKMAKQQELVLNTCKLSGPCGRLMCCLGYEYDENGGRRRREDRDDRTVETEEDLYPQEFEDAVKPEEPPVSTAAGSEPERRPEHRPERRSERRSERRPERRSERRPERRSERRSEPRPESRPEPKPQAEQIPESKTQDGQSPASGAEAASTEKKKPRRKRGRSRRFRGPRKKKQ
jgi:cell fate regulator YaaT (PSP1 superfamily)